MRWWYCLVVLSVVLLPVQASAQHGKWSPHTPYCPTPYPYPYPHYPQGPGQWPTPTEPPTTTPPGTTPPTTTPDPTTPETPTSPADSFAQAPPAGSASPTSFAPNIFGDQFGMGGTQVRFTAPVATAIVRPGALDQQAGSLRFDGATFDTAAGQYRWVSTTPTAKGQVFSPIGNAGLAFPTPDLFSQAGPNLAGGGSATVSVDPSAAAFIQRNAANGQPLFLAVSSLEQGANPNVVLLSLVYTPDANMTIGPVPGGANEFPLTYPGTFATTVQETRVLPGLAFALPNPSGGGAVGRVQTAEDISPLPRDRFIFNYDYFNNSSLTANGWDVHRFVFGIEKTFFDQNASIELRLPVASTLNSELTHSISNPEVGNNSNTEFGSVRLLFKGLLFGNDVINVAAGLAVHLPTADDSRVDVLVAGPLAQVINGQVVLSATGVSTLAEIRNETVILSPYFGALFTPNDRLFFQSWTAVDVDPWGNPVYINPTLQNLQLAGRLNDQTLLQQDFQLGYWLVVNDDPNAFLTRLAPFVELHYSTTLQDADVVQLGNVAVTDGRNRRDELNLSAGVIALFSNRMNVSAGCVVPLRDEDNRSFDFQVGVRANIFFGAATAPMATLFGP